LSGFQYRKQKLQKLDNNKKLAESLKKYLQQENDLAQAGTSSTTDFRAEIEENFPQVEEDCAMETNVPDVTDVEEGSNQGECEESIEDQQHCLLPEDPAEWPEVLSPAFSRMLVEKGPGQVNDWNYPANESGRKFSINYYYRLLPNGEKVKRDWLIYSISKNSVYCFCCKIFGKMVTNLSNKEGFSDWQHLSFILSRHEKSVAHNENLKSWLNLGNMLSKKLTVNQKQLRLLDVEKKHWHNVLERIISVIQFLSRQCLALRGTSAKLYEHSNGNFLKAIEMIAKFDSVMSEHVRRVQRAQKSDTVMANYLGDKIQNELIDLIGSKIKQYILDLIRKHKYYSIILDCTPDVSHSEQMTVVIRFVAFNESLKKVELHEHFLEFCPISDSTGKGLSEFLIDLLSKLNLNIYDMRGQGYDNGANMRGKHNGLQKKILEINPRAFFVPCTAHTLNLVVNDAAKINFEASGFFDLVQELYVFFSGSTKRWSVLKKYIADLNLKPLSDTRWSSRIDAIKPLRYQIGPIYDALIEVMEHSSQDVNSSHQARSLAFKIHNYKFLCSVIIWYNILFKINSLSKILQSPAVNIKICLSHLKNLVDFFSNFRSDEGFNEVLVDANVVAEEFDVETNFPMPQTVRPRKKTKFFDYEHNDEPITDPKTSFTITVFFNILDQILSSLKD
jgi:hypothetical protein